MMVIEFRQAAYDKAFDLVDSVKDYCKSMKMTLCALEDALSECYDASMNSDDEEEYEEDFKIPTEDEEDDDLEINYRKGLNRAMRRNMRMRYHDMNSGMRMRMRRSSRR